MWKLFGRDEDDYQADYVVTPASDDNTPAPAGDPAAQISETPAAAVSAEPTSAAPEPSAPANPAEATPSAATVDSAPVASEPVHSPSDYVITPPADPTAPLPSAPAPTDSSAASPASADSTPASAIATDAAPVSPSTDASVTPASVDVSAPATPETPPVMGDTNAAAPTGYYYDYAAMFEALTGGLTESAKPAVNETLGGGVSAPAPVDAGAPAASSDMTAGLGGLSAGPAATPDLGTEAQTAVSAGLPSLDNSAAASPAPEVSPSPTTPEAEKSTEWNLDNVLGITTTALGLMKDDPTLPLRDAVQKAFDNQNNTSGSDVLNANATPAMPLDLSALTQPSVPATPTGSPVPAVPAGTPQAA